MALGHFRLLTTLLLGCLLTQQAFGKEKPKPPKALSLEEHLYEAISDREWKKALKLSSDLPSQDFFTLIKMRAHFELGNWTELLETPGVEDKLFIGYDQYLRSLAAFETKAYKRLEEFAVHDDLPPVLKESLYLLRAKALSERGMTLEAKNAYRLFLKSYPYSPHISDVYLELAELEWKLENKFEALALYEKIYKEHPLRDRKNIAEQRLEKSGRLINLNADAHLARVQQLKRAALYKKALKELKDLKKRKQLDGPDKDRVDLAIARLQFAQKRYSLTQELAEEALKKEITNTDNEIAWKRILAFSLTRQGKYDKSREVYSSLLAMKIPGWLREKIYLRLGLMALDDNLFADADLHFGKLRTEFPNGNYRESSHWFQAWAIYRDELLNKEKGPSYQLNQRRLSDAAGYLKKLPDLPEGENLTAQAIYWRGQINLLAGNKKEFERTRQKLMQKWQASFHSMLISAKSFDFLNFNSLFITKDLVREQKPRYKVADPTFQQPAWKRLEAFAKAKLYTWAELELERFLSRTGRKNEGLRNAVANRLRLLEDWSDLIKYAQRQFDFDLEELDTENELSLYFYPQSYHQYVLASAQEWRVSPFLIWGVMREESRFQADVISPAGAVGLLQLMPSLGARIGKKLDDSPAQRQELTEAERNVRYGVFHLRELINQVQSWDVPDHFVMPLVVASYNAGTTPVKRWIKESGTDRLDIFVESIPYAETRGYVKRVLQSAKIYYLLYGERVRELAKSKGETKL